MSTESETTHIIAPFEMNDDVSLSAIHRYEKLISNEIVMLWSHKKPHLRFEKLNIRLIESYQGVLPQAGKLIVISSKTYIGEWYQHAKFSKVSLVHMHEEQTLFFRLLHQLSLGGLKNVSLEYSSDRISQIIGLSESSTITQ